MGKLRRFGVSLSESLLEKFDRYVQGQGCPTRSKAISDLIREKLVKQEWIRGKTVAGAILLVYDHHRRDLVNKLTDIQHDYYKLIISSQHVHLDHLHCLEIVVVRGKPKEIQALHKKLQSTKGVKFSSLTAASTGKEL